ncbi:hypothetical protein HORIV_67400 [Vreelandella olivaria]|uniref:Uncharacterized protein n=1 Tax=Vreelandella olivaria TaxID=390919 RepID=A0ABM7GTY0_9GAMM|nr:hypothetical protein HORIV_67400 [Halomonas olivaria]
MDPIIVLAILVGLIVIGFPIFLALGLSGLAGLYMARGSLAFFSPPPHCLGSLMPSS